MVTKDRPISPWFLPYVFLSRCNFSTLTTRQKLVEFYILLTRVLALSVAEVKIQTLVFTSIELTTSALLVGVRGYLLDHSGDAFKGKTIGKFDVSQSSSMGGVEDV